MKKVILLSLIASTPLLAKDTETTEKNCECLWHQIDSGDPQIRRHEGGYVRVGDFFYLVGGRGIRPVDVYDPEKNIWSKLSKPPIELHHFQAVTYKDEIYIAGALTGPYPAETPVPHIYIYNPGKDEWRKGPEIPKNRRRGAAAACLIDSKLYLFNGIIDGHRSGWVNWTDVLDLETGEWKVLADSPQARDHFQVDIIDNKVIVAGGRRSGEGGNTFKAVIKETDAYDLTTGKWSTYPSPAGDIPTPRAGTSSITVGDYLYVVGGESASIVEAHREVEAFDPSKGTWKSKSPLLVGRHATQIIKYKGKLYTAAGSSIRGAKEVNTQEVLEISTDCCPH